MHFIPELLCMSQNLWSRPNMVGQPGLQWLQGNFSTVQQCSAYAICSGERASGNDSHGL
jgi:hypothetical protein